MIKIGITGAATPIAGEIIKLLVNHPDVEIVWAFQPDFDGALISAIHKGLRGETYLRFTADANVDDVDMIFHCFDEPGKAKQFAERYNVPQHIRVVDVTGDYLNQSTFADGDDWIFGVPELCRKPMVRGSRHASIPSPLASSVIIGLAPLAKKHWLNSDIEVMAVVAEEDAEPGEALALLDVAEMAELQRALQSLQPHFELPMRFTVVNGGWQHGLSLTMHFVSEKSEAELVDAFDTYYDDHNFTFLTETMPNLREVAGTNKCIINVQKVGEYAVISLVMDSLIKGFAGMAVHDMNLLFGLQERVGLMLKTNP